ncbi:hypothetical protein VTN00DRAFT_6179 [Thermoascus crustaceus]|uniref:uncharacterized protein n=1 Tax=Thermoascus crustaceus TaxID=5088 RepID=UPI0037432A3D
MGADHLARGGDMHEQEPYTSPSGETARSTMLRQQRGSWWYPIPTVEREAADGPLKSVSGQVVDATSHTGREEQLYPAVGQPRSGMAEIVDAGDPMRRAVTMAGEQTAGYKGAQTRRKGEKRLAEQPWTNAARRGLARLEREKTIMTLLNRGWTRSGSPSGLSELRNLVPSSSQLSANLGNATRAHFPPAVTSHTTLSEASGALELELSGSATRPTRSGEPLGLWARSPVGPCRARQLISLTSGTEELIRGMSTNGKRITRFSTLKAEVLRKPSIITPKWRSKVTLWRRRLATVHRGTNRSVCQVNHGLAQP